MHRNLTFSLYMIPSIPYSTSIEVEIFESPRIKIMPLESTKINHMMEQESMKK